MDKTITADWARTTSKTVMGEKVAKQLKQCEQAIKIAVHDNKENVSVSIYLEDVTRNELQSRGFKVREVPEQSQRDPGYIVISW